MGDGAGIAETERLLEHLIVPQGFVVRMKEEVRMAFDQPRQERRARERYPLGAGRRPDPGLGADRLDPGSPNHHDPAALRGLGDAIPHRVRGQHGHLGTVRHAGGLGLDPAGIGQPEDGAREEGGQDSHWHDLSGRPGTGDGA